MDTSRTVALCTDTREWAHPTLLSILTSCSYSEPDGENLGLCALVTETSSPSPSIRSPMLQVLAALDA